jgi:hypothetical protein
VFPVTCHEDCCTLGFRCFPLPVPLRVGAVDRSGASTSVFVGPVGGLWVSPTTEVATVLFNPIVAPLLQSLTTSHWHIPLPFFDNRSCPLPVSPLDCRCWGPVGGSSVSPTTEVATVLFNPIGVTMLICGGFYISIDSLPKVRKRPPALAHVWPRLVDWDDCHPLADWPYSATSRSDRRRNSQSLASICLAKRLMAIGCQTNGWVLCA